MRRFKRGDIVKVGGPQPLNNTTRVEERTIALVLGYSDSLHGSTTGYTHFYRMLWQGKVCTLADYHLEKIE